MAEAKKRYGLMQRLKARFVSPFPRFIKERRGGVAIFIAAMIIPMVGFLGVATDAARGYLVQSRLSYALDAAGLAGARVMFSPTRDSDIQMYFEANFPPDYMGATVTGPTFAVDSNGEVLTVTASATIQAMFVRLIGFDTITVSAETEVTRKTELLEVVLAMDMSGSMSNGAGGGVTRIEASRNAAKELVNILFGSDEVKTLFKIGLVPWNGKVNVTLNGTAYDPSLTTTQAVPTFSHPLTGAGQSVIYFANNSPVPLLDPPDTDWKGCAYSRYSDDGDDTDDADRSYGAVTIGGAEWPAWEPIGPGGEPMPGTAKCVRAVGNSECRPCLQHGITPMVSTKSEIVAAIDELTSPAGTTNIPQGFGWAWRVLMPDAPFTEAASSPPGNRQRAIVLLTDGENFGGSGDGYKAAFGLGASARPEMDDRLLELAAAVKAEGVVVYAIQFGNNGIGLQNLLKAVASGPDAPFYFHAPDAETLRQAFREVANNLSQLRLSR
jgi:Flp pilus assembly protein TadG